eukprot:3088799-Prymnesium_polylepis.1
MSGVTRTTPHSPARLRRLSGARTARRAEMTGGAHGRPLVAGPLPLYEPRARSAHDGPRQPAPRRTCARLRFVSRLLNFIVVR